MAPKKNKPKVPDDWNGAIDFYLASYQNAQNRGELPTVFLPRPFEPTSTVPPPDKNIPLCSKCGRARDADHVPGYRCFVSMKCGHSFCTICILFTMPGKTTCIAADCEQPISDAVKSKLKKQLRSWQIDEAVELTREKKGELIIPCDATTTIEPNYEKAAAFLQQDPPAPSNRAVCIDIDHLHPHLLALANLLPSLRRIQLQPALDPTLWIEALIGIHNLLLKLKGGKKYVSGTMLYDYLRENMNHWLHKKSATMTEIKNVDLLLKYVVHVSEEKSLWNQSRAIAREKSTQVKEALEPYLEGIKEISGQSVFNVRETLRRSMAVVKPPTQHNISKL